MDTIVTEMSCGCQVKLDFKADGTDWSVVRRCKRSITPSPDLKAVHIDHVHALEARIDELRGSIQGR